MGLEAGNHQNIFNARAARPAAALRTVLLVDASAAMMTPQDGAPAPCVTAMRGIAKFMRRHPRLDIEVQAVNAQQLQSIPDAESLHRISLFENEDLARGITALSARGPSRIVALTDRDPRDPDAVRIAARGHIRRDARNRIDFLIVSAQWNAFALGGMIEHIGGGATLKCAATPAEAAAQLGSLLAPAAAPANAPKPR